jgi:hypothetical protein
MLHIAGQTARGKKAWAGTGKGEVVRARGAKTRIAYPGHNTLASVSRALRDEPPIAVAALASLMIDRTVAMQRPQFSPQPRHLYTANGVRGHALLLRAALISESVRTLQEQMIINAPSVKPMDVPESGSLTRRLLIRKTRMEYFLRLELYGAPMRARHVSSGRRRHRFQKNPRCNRGAREPAVSRNPGWLGLDLGGMMTLSGRYAEALTELGLKPGDRAGALGLRRAPGFNSYARSRRDGPARPGLPRPRRAQADWQIAPERKCIRLLARNGEGVH